MNLLNDGKIIDHNSAHDIFLMMGDFNIEIKDRNKELFSKNSVKVLICFKNPLKPIRYPFLTTV